MANQGAIRAGKAFVELFADDSKLVRGLRAAESKIRAFGDTVSTMGRGMSVAGAALAAPLVAATKTFISVGSSLADMAQRTGLAVESLSRLQYVATQTGTDLAVFESAIRRMQRTVYDAERSLSTAVDALAALGLNVRQLQGQSPERQFMLIADRLSRVDDASQRAALAMMVFGRSGTALMPMINEGVDGIAKLQREADRLGLTISGETAAAADNLGDSLESLWLTVKAGAVHVGAALAPALQDMVAAAQAGISRFNQWIKVNGDLVVRLAKLAAITTATGIALTVFGGVVRAVAFIVKSATMISKAYAAAQAAVQALSGPAGIAMLAAGLAAAAAGLAAVDHLLDKHVNTLLDAAETTNDVADATNTESTALSDVALAADASALEIDGLTQSYDELAKKMQTVRGPRGQIIEFEEGSPLDRLSEQARSMGLDEFELAERHLRENGQWSLATEGYLNWLRDITAERRKQLSLEEEASRVSESMKTPTERHAEQTAKLNTMLERRLITQQTFNRALEEANKTLAEATKSPELERMQAQAESIIEATRTPMERLRASVKELGELLKAGFLDRETYRRALEQAAAQTAGADINMRVQEAMTAAMGTFSGLAVGRMSIGGISQKLVDASVETAKNTRDILREVEDGGTFT